jgi:hypothetical protein
LIVVGSADFLTDEILRFTSSVSRSQYTAPLQLAENMVDWSLEDRGLLSIRGGPFCPVVKTHDERNPNVLGIFKLRSGPGGPGGTLGRRAMAPAAPAGVHPIPSFRNQRRGNFMNKTVKILLGLLAAQLGIGGGRVFEKPAGQEPLATMNLCFA